MVKQLTSNNRKSFIVWILSTLILHSSNAVSVLVLSFVWTGILTVVSAFAIMLGSNVGTTLTGALFWLIGTSYDVTMFAYPLLFFWAVWITFFKKREFIQKIGKGFIGLALIFFALMYMKDWMMFITEFDLTCLTSMPVIVFFWIGLLITLLVQSWSATFIIALTSLSVNVIPLPCAIAMMLGWYLWSTVTIILASFGTNASKRQTAYFHVVFNASLALLWLLTLPWIVKLLENIVIPNLWLEHSFALLYIGLRVVCALLWLPFVNPVYKLFKRKIQDQEQEKKLSIEKLEPPIDQEVAFLAIKQDILFYLKNIINYNLNIWDFYLADIKKEEKSDQELLAEDFDFGQMYFQNSYRELKNIQEALLRFLLLLNQKNDQTLEDSEKNNTLYQVILWIGDSSKHLKDVWEIVDDWKRSTSESLQQDYKVMRKMVLDFYKELLQVLVNLDNKNAIDMIHQLLDKIQKNDRKYIKMYKKDSTDLKLSNIIQVNRYFSLSCLSLVNAVEKITLTKEEKKYIKDLF